MTKDNLRKQANLESDLLQELARQSSDEIRKLRTHERLETKVNVLLSPANSSAMGEGRIQGETRDISKGGCMALFVSPVAVGDIFTLQFDKSSVDLPLVFARCLRCRLVREDAFEAGFSFFTPISLSKGAEKPSKDLLG